MSKLEASVLDKIVGANLNRLRTLAGFSQKALGEAIELSSQQISKFELGIDRMRSDQLYECSVLCGCEVQALFEGVAEAMPSEFPPGCYALLNREDLAMVKNYQQLTPEMRESVRTYVAAILKSITEKLGGSRDNKNH